MLYEWVHHQAYYVLHKHVTICYVLCVLKHAVHKLAQLCFFEYIYLEKHSKHSLTGC